MCTAKPWLIGAGLGIVCLVVWRCGIPDGAGDSAGPVVTRSASAPTEAVIAPTEGSPAAVVTDYSADGPWDALSTTMADLADHVRGSVVHITSAELHIAPSNSTARDVLGLPEEIRVTGGLGSGTVVADDGMILTNEHVVRGVNRVQVVLEDGTIHDARRVAEDRDLDIALLHIDRQLRSLRWGDSQTLRPGVWVVALGSPFRALDHSLSCGVISGTRRNLGAGPYADLLQSNTVIHPGFSGGPLLNRQGEILGIHVATVGLGGAGLSLALPAHRIRSAVERMLRTEQ